MYIYSKPLRLHQLKSATHQKTPSYTHTKWQKPRQKKLWTTTKEGNTSNRYHNKSHKHTVKDNRHKTTNSERNEKPHKDRNEGSTNDRQPNGRKHRKMNNGTQAQTQPPINNKKHQPPIKKQITWREGETTQTTGRDEDNTKDKHKHGQTLTRQEWNSCCLYSIGCKGRCWRASQKIRCSKS